MAHIHEKIDWTVDVYIVHQHKVLLRLHEKYHIWLGVGGHIELDEDPLQAAKRECLEEVGLTITVHGEKELERMTDEESRDLPIPAFLNIHRVSPTHEHIGMVYVATSDSDVVVPENETDTWAWLTRDEVLAKEDMLTKVRQYALYALDTFASEMK